MRMLAQQAMHPPGTWAPRPPFAAVTAVAAVAAVAADVLLAADEAVEPSLPLASDGVRRWVWHSRYGAMLIEAIGTEVFVNGQRVEPHAP
jgi:hypothetical protein